MVHPEALAYRRRAGELRALARTMRTMQSMSLHLHAGVDTWYGPRAQACTDHLGRARQAVHDAADELEIRAIGFERLADELVAQAVSSPIDRVG